MTRFNLHPVERAFQLARTGHFRVRGDISKALEKEGYTVAEVYQLQGAAITRQINDLCRAAQAERQAPNEAA
jgi:hypothetical protein